VKASTPRRLACLLALPLLASCVYTKVRVPLDEDLNKTRLGDRTGQAEFQSVLWLAAWGDAGTQAAAQQGELETINHADREIFSILGGLYYRQTTIVYGD